MYYILNDYFLINSLIINMAISESSRQNLRSITKIHNSVMYTHNDFNHSVREYNKKYDDNKELLKNHKNIKRYENSIDMANQQKAAIGLYARMTVYCKSHDDANEEHLRNAFNNYHRLLEDILTATITLSAMRENMMVAISKSK